MCGIIWAKRLDGKPAKKSVNKRFTQQISRGTQGFGFVEVRDNIVYEAQRAMTQEVMHKKLNETEASEILFHHRIPTSTPNLLEATHPILVAHESLKYLYYVIHNGIISNAKDLKEKYEKEGFVYTTAMHSAYVTQWTTYKETGSDKFNDSESLAIDVAKMLDTDGKELKSWGSIAFMAFQFDKETAELKGMYFGRNGRNPLKLDITKERVIIASEGNGVEVEPFKLWQFNYQENKADFVRDLTIGGAVKEYEYGSGSKAVTPYKGTLWNRNDWDDNDEDRPYTAAWHKTHTWDSILHTYRPKTKTEIDLEEIEAYELDQETDTPITVYHSYADDKGSYKEEYATFEEFNDAYVDLIEELAENEMETLPKAVIANDEKEIKHIEAYIDLLKEEIKTYDTIMNELEYADYQRGS